jgi:hypothetical protein
MRHKIISMTVTQILDMVIPYPVGCRSCGQRQRALKRMAFAEWIETHRHLTDAQIIERLKKIA